MLLIKSRVGHSLPWGGALALVVGLASCSAAPSSGGPGAMEAPDAQAPASTGGTIGSQPGTGGQPAVDAPGTDTSVTVDSGANDALGDGPAGGDVAPVRPGKALIYIFSNLYFRHPSIEPAADTLDLELKARGFTTEISKDPGKFSTANLRDLTLVIMIGSCGTPLGEPETESVAALDAWLKAGGALVGLHAASAVKYPPSSRFVAIMGGRFVDHPGNIRPSACVAQGTHPSIINLPKPFMVRDEIYRFDGYNSTNQIDLQCAAVDGSSMLPIAWHRTEGLGRVFYSALGHEIQHWVTDSPLVKDHVLPGILWAIGR